MQEEHPYFEILGRLTKAGIPYCVVGLMGASFHGSDQTTYDLDMVVEPTKNTLSQVRKFLKNEGFTEGAIFKGEILKPPPTDDNVIKNKITLFYTDPYGLSIDVMTVISGINFKKLWKNCEKILVGKQTIYVASLKDIILSKSTANRAKDRIHLKHLKALLNLKKD